MGILVALDVAHAKRLGGWVCWRVGVAPGGRREGWVAEFNAG